jgi:hypothetical protein
MSIDTWYSGSAHIASTRSIAARAASDGRGASSWRRVDSMYGRM